MTSYLLAGPATEPVSLAEAKAHARIDGDAEDGLVETLIAAARIHIESLTARALIAQGWRAVLDAWPTSRVVNLPVSPLMALTTVTAYDADGAGTELDLAQFQMEVAPARLLLPLAVDGAPTLRERQGLEIDYVAGYGADAEDVPADLRQALLALVAYWYQNRDAVVIAGSGALVPSGFDRMVAPYRVVRI